MELADDDFDAYELDETGMVVKSPADGSETYAGHANSLAPVNSPGANTHTKTNVNNNNGKIQSTSSETAFSAQLAAKVRAQAKDLQRLEGELQDVQEYSRLCEQRICELQPSHPIPVTTDCLGVTNPAGSTAASRVAGRGGGTGKSAKLRRENAELAEANKALEKQLRFARSKLADTSRNLKETRIQSERKDRELDYREKRISKLEARLAELERRTNASSGSIKERGSPPKAKSPSIDLLPGEGVAEEAAAQLRKDVASLRQSLQNEARTNEEQRVYIKVLETAVQSKAGDMGLTSGQASLLTKVARLEGELQAKQREQDAANAAVSAMEAEMEDLRKREDAQSSASRAQQENIKMLSERLAQFGRGEGELLSSVQQLESEKTALLDYVQENVARTAELTHQVQALESDKLRLEKERRDAEASMRNDLRVATQNQELLKLKSSEGEATVSALKEDASALRLQLQQEQQAREEAENNYNSAVAEAEELKEVQNELLETIREKTKSLGKATRELGMTVETKSTLALEVASLQSKLQKMSLKMEAQKDLLRQDAASAVASLERELADAVGAHEACKQKLAMAEERAAKIEKDLQISEGDVDTLERTRDQLLAERGNQAARLDDLERAQEQSEKDVGELQEALSDATEELMVLRQVRAACDKIKGDLGHMRGLSEMEEAAKMAEDSGGAFTVEVVVVEGKGETTVMTPSRKSKAESGDRSNLANAQALAERFASWCCVKNTSRQLRQASLPLLARGINILGSQFEANSVALQRTLREKEVIQRSLQEDIYSLRSQLETTRNSETRLSEAQKVDKDRIHELSEEVKDTRRMLNQTSSDLEGAEARVRELRSSLEDRENRLSSIQNTLSEVERELEVCNLQRNQMRDQVESQQEECERLKSQNDIFVTAKLELETEVSRLSKDIAKKQQDIASLQEGHLRDREVLHEKISRSEKSETKAFEKAQLLSVRVAELESKVTHMSGELADESTMSQQASNEIKRLKDQLHAVTADKNRLTVQLNTEQRSHAAEKDAFETRNAGLEARLHSLTETKGITDSTVVALSTEVESIRRTILRAVDDVCAMYGHESLTIANFTTNRSLQSPGSSKKFVSPIRGNTKTPSKSIAAPQIEGVRNAVRQVSALLHSLASGSASQHNNEQKQLASIMSQSSITESELRHAQELLSQARAQHASALRSTSANLEREREHNRQLQVLVERLQNEAASSGGSVGVLQARCAKLDGQVISLNGEIRSLRSQCEGQIEEISQLRDEILSKDSKIFKLRHQLEESQGELESLEVQVTTDLSSLSEQHNEVNKVAQKLRIQLEEAQSELRLTEGSLADANFQRDQLSKEVKQQQISFNDQMEERMSSARVENQSLKTRLADAVAQAEQIKLKSESEIDSLRSELASSEATVGMLREQNEQLQEQCRDALAEAQRASQALSGQESLVRAERVQNDSLSNRVGDLEGELSRMRRLATERGVVASNRSMEINELRDSLSRVEKALDSSPKAKMKTDAITADESTAPSSEIRILSPGATPLPMDTGNNYEDSASASRNSSMIGSSNQARRLDLSGPIRALPMPLPEQSTSHNSMVTKVPSYSSSSAKIHVSRRGSISITTGTPSVSSVGSRVRPSPAAARVRERLSAVRKQFAEMKQRN